MNARHPIFYAIWRQFDHFYIAALLMIIAVGFGALNVIAFRLRRDYSKAHRPEVSIFDHIRSLRGERRYAR